MNKRLLIGFIMVFITTLPAIGQGEREEFVVDFAVGKTFIRNDLGDNAASLLNFRNHIDSALQDSTVTVIKLTVFGSTSPEGAYERNIYLAGERIDALVRFIEQEYPQLSNHIFKCNSDIPYEKFEDYILHSNFSEEEKEGITEILHKDFTLVPYPYADGDSLHIDSRLVELMRYDDGREWSRMEKEIFPEFRHTHIYVDIFRKMASLPHLGSEESPVYMLSETKAPSITRPQQAAVLHTKETAVPEQKSKKVRYKKEILELVTLKTNGIGWLMLIANASMELHFTQRVSLNLPFYYSGGVNYFVHDVKFRGIVFQPELRYHFAKAKGLYLGAHGGVGWYNFALNGDYRIQDHSGLRPAVGGGIGVGYRFHFPHLPRLGMEFSLGAGVYDAVYDKFYNEPNGPLVEEGIHTTFIGIDQASVSLIYSLGKKIKTVRQ